MSVQQDAPSPPRQPADPASGVKEADEDDLPSVDLDPRTQDLWQALDQPSEPSAEEDKDSSKDHDEAKRTSADEHVRKAQDATQLQSPEDESLQRPFSLQSVALSDQEPHAPEASDSAFVGKQTHKPAELDLSNSQPPDASASASHGQDSPIQQRHPEIDLDLDDLESVPYSASTDTQPATSIGRLATSHSFNNAISSPSLSASSASNPASPGNNNKLAQPPTPSSKVSNLRSRFEQQQSPTTTTTTATAHERQLSNHTLTSSTSSSSVATTHIRKSPSGPFSGSPTKPQPSAGGAGPPAAPVTPLLSSADKRRSLQMLQADFQRKKAELQQHQPAAAVDLKQKGKEHPITEERDEIDWDFWSLVVNDYTAVARDQPKRLSEAIQKGIPQALRGLLWQLMSASKDPELEESYLNLLKLPCTHEKAILRDIARTFPHHKYFQEGHVSGKGAGQDNLFNVAKCYALYDEEVGYCQGLQFVVGPLLLNMPDEEAFCVMVRLMNSYGLRSHYTPNMTGLQMRLFQFDKLLEELLPAVFLHLTRQGVKSSMYASQWWLTLFGYRLPLQLVQTVMDLVFAEGVEAVFRFSIALMQHNEDRILKLSFEEVVEFLKSSVYEHWKLQDADEDDPDRQYDANQFIKDALAVKIAPTLLDQYASEWEASRREQDAHQIEVEGLRRINASLSGQVRRLEGSLASINEEHCDLVKQVVQARLEKEAMEEELVRYKLRCAELAHQRESISAAHPPPIEVPTSFDEPEPPAKAHSTPSVSSAASSFFGGIRPSWGRKETTQFTPPLSASAKSSSASFTSSQTRVNGES